MKAIVLLAFLAAYSCYRPGKQTPITEAKDTATTQSVQIEARLSFEKDIQPILQSNCTPCHFTGGKMYEKMPFDKPKTIIDHREGILRRMKGEEKEKIVKFITQEKI